MRELDYSDWIKELNETSDTFSNRLQRMDHANYFASRVSGRLGPNSQYSYSSINELSYRKILRNDGLLYAYSAYFILETEPVLVRYPDDEEVEEWNGQVEEAEVEHIRYITVRELRDMTDLSQKRFADLFLIPHRTIQNWENSVSECPEYTLLLMCEYVHRLLKNYH